MKKSKKVPAALVAAVAAFVASGCGCGRGVTEVRRCVDSTGHVLPDYMCSSSGYSSGGYYGGSYYRSPHWGYGGSMSGGSLGGYRSTPTSGADIADSSGHTISRGGFGGGSGGGGGGDAGG